MIAHMRIDEVEDENEHTEDQAYDPEDAVDAWERNRDELEIREQEASPKLRHRESKGSNVFNRNSQMMKQSMDSAANRSYD